MRIRTLRLALALVAMFALAGTAAALATAAYYESSRPALKIDFLTRHHQITRIGFRILVRCERRADGSAAGSAVIASGTTESIPFNRVNGRFRARLTVQG